MRKYETPVYQPEDIEAQEVILASMTVSTVGEGTLGSVTGFKAQASMSFNDLFGSR